jgi:hypothetical protein
MNKNQLSLQSISNQQKLKSLEKDIIGLKEKGGLETNIS